MLLLLFFNLEDSYLAIFFYIMLTIFLCVAMHIYKGGRGSIHFASDHDGKLSRQYWLVLFKFLFLQHCRIGFYLF